MADIINRSQSAPVIPPLISRARSASLIMNQYKTEQVPLSPREVPKSPRGPSLSPRGSSVAPQDVIVAPRRKTTERFFVRNIEGQIARIATKDGSSLDKTIDPYDPEIVNQVLKGQRDEYKIVWIDGLDFHVGKINETT